MASRSGKGKPEGLRYGGRHHGLRYVCAVALVLFVAQAFRPAARAQTPAPADREQTEALSRRAAERLASLQKEAEGLAKQEKTLLVELRALEVQREIKAEELATIQRDTAKVSASLADTTRRADALEKEAERQRPDVEARMVELYKMGRAGYWRLLLDVNSLRDVARAYRTAAALGRIDRDRVEAHRRTLAALTQERTTLQGKLKEEAALKRKAEAARAALESAVAARTDLVNQIDDRRDLNAQLTGELQDAQRKLQSTLAQLAGGTSAPAAVLPLRPFQGALPWPVDGVVSARFGRTRGAAGTSRAGIELSVPEGEAVRAVHEGTVVYADPFSGYGNLVIIDHGDKSYSLYGHLSSLSVKKGERVDPTTTVGLAGRNPSGNPSLYFELRVDGAPVDPLQWLKRQ